MPSITRLLREPFLHFLAIGVGLLAVDALWISGDIDRGEGRERIEVTAVEIGWLGGNFKARWQRPPTATELRGLVESFVREEVLYREALAAELDRDDEVIRRRMVQKLEFMTEDLAAQQPPTDAELESYLEENLDTYRIPERRGIRQIYFNVDRRGDGVRAAAEKLLAELRSSPSSLAAAEEKGDRLLLQHDSRAQTKAQIARSFGKDFAAAVFQLEPDGWHGPIASGYGLHLARVTEVREGAAPKLAAVRDTVLRDYSTMVKRKAREAMYAALSKGYEIKIDEEAIRVRSLPVPADEGAR